VTEPPVTEPPVTEPPVTEPPVTEPPTSTAPAEPAGPNDYVARANSVCASGFRAPLEQASLRYLGPNEGWGRLDDLVDEQEGPFYFQAWEPGYPDDVTVLITLSEPVLATAVLVAQDPFTPVSGTIDVDSAAFAGSIDLSGTDGFRSLDLDQALPLSGLTIRRDGPDENIMEVLVCVAPPQ